MTIQRNYSAKHKKSEIHKVSLENKLLGNEPNEIIKFKCECGHLIRKNFLNRHLNSAIHETGLRIQSEKKKKEQVLT
jgi:hypothetical protein